MHYDIKLGFLAADAISEFSKATTTKEKARYRAFLERSAEYCKAVRKAYGRPLETEIPTTMPNSVADFMRAIANTQRLPPAVTQRIAAITFIEKSLRTIRKEKRLPSDDECLRIAKTIYATSVADPI